MKAVGIIAEYNPFHSGHAYHIAKTREITGCDAVVCLMSGDYVQRGSAAITDKYTRAGMAVKGGADLVIELPVLFSLSASEIFARGAVDILTGITGISYLSFGAEKCDLTALNKAAALFLFEPDEYKISLNAYLKSGKTFPQARKEAAGSLLENPDILDSPNNILAIEYLKALNNAPGITPVCIKREGNDYNDSAATGKYISSTAVRSLIGGRSTIYSKSHPAYSEISAYSDIPDGSGLLSPAAFNDLIIYSLISNRDHLTDYLDVNESVSDRINNLIDNGELIKAVSEKNADIPMLLKTRNITYTRAARMLYHILLGIRKDSHFTGGVKVLAFNDTGRHFLNGIKKNTGISLITNPGKTDILEPVTHNASLIYNNVFHRETGIIIGDDYRHRPVIM